MEGESRTLLHTFDPAGRSTAISAKSAGSRFFTEPTHSSSAPRLSPAVSRTSVESRILFICRVSLSEGSWNKLLSPRVHHMRYIHSTRAQASEPSWRNGREAYLVLQRMEAHPQAKPLGPAAQTRCWVASDEPPMTAIRWVLYVSCLPADLAKTAFLAKDASPKHAAVAGTFVPACASRFWLG